MCRNSRNGVKNIVSLFFVFVLLASPCFARASWAGLFDPKEPTVSSAEVLKDSARASQEEFSQVLSTEVSQKAETLSYDELIKQLNTLETAYTESQNEVANLSSWLETLKGQLETFAETNKISDAEYDEVKAIVGTLAERADSTADVVAEQQARIDELEAKNAKLKTKAGTQAYGKINTIVGFSNGVPEWSAGLSLGTKFGFGMIMEMGANYKIGDLANPISVPSWDIDRLTVSASFGWTF